MSGSGPGSGSGSGPPTSSQRDDDPTNHHHKHSPRPPLNHPSTDPIQVQHSQQLQQPTQNQKRSLFYKLKSKSKTQPLPVTSTYPQQPGTQSSSPLSASGQLRSRSSGNQLQHQHQHQQHPQSYGYQQPQKHHQQQQQQHQNSNQNPPIDNSGTFSNTSSSVSTLPYVQIPKPPRQAPLTIQSVTPLSINSNTKLKFPPNYGYGTGGPNPPPKPRDKPKSKLKTKEKKSSLLSLTKKATKIAGDLAFGSANINMHEAEDKRFEEFKIKRRQEAEAKRQREFVQLKKKINDQSMMLYIKHFRLFTDYIKEAEFNDPLKYALTRRDLFVSWYEKFLIGLREDIERSEAFIQSREIRQNETRANSYLGSVAGSGTGPLTINNPTSGAGASGERRVSNSSGSSSGGVSGGFRRSMSSTSLKLDSAIADQLNLAVVHDNKTIMILLWYLQIQKKMLNQPNLIHQDIQMRLAGVDSLNLDPSIVPDIPETCIVTLSKMSHFTKNINDGNKDLISNSILASNVEFVDGWLMRHDNMKVHTNLVTITDEFKVLTDVQKKGYLTRDLMEENPEFDSPVLDNDFLSKNMNKDEMKFMENYSSFTSKSTAFLPFRNETQSCLVCADLSVLVSDVTQLSDTLFEFKRVLKPGGFLQLNLWDLDLFSKNTSVNFVPQDCFETLRNKIWEKAVKFAKDRNLMIPNITSVIIPLLKMVGFKKIKYAYVAYPQISTLHEDVENAGNTGTGSTNSTNSSPTPMRSTPESTNHNIMGGNRDRGNGSEIIEQKGFKDPRLNCFFELFSNYNEFILFSKILSILKVSVDAKCYQVKAELEAEEKLQKSSFSGVSGNNGSFTTEELLRRGSSFTGKFAGSSPATGSSSMFIQNSPNQLGMGMGQGMGFSPGSEFDRRGSATTRRGSNTTQDTTNSSLSDSNSIGGSGTGFSTGERFYQRQQQRKAKLQLLDAKIENFKSIDYELLRFVKLFIDYKLHGFDGELVKQEFGSELDFCVSGGRSGSGSKINGSAGNIHDGVRNEGFTYMMVLTAEK
ncbi:unnamed protein product [Ambrosiozyma monospora]|uniref:Unnamed protein product n=1 Tax=Ambrosiozyma monospora TaxID=43982 RepID=A0A9W6YUB0_AMBMO|nr:unnamed protein product [Ambrosiozyma monospora]